MPKCESCRWFRPEAAHGWDGPSDHDNSGKLYLGYWLSSRGLVPAETGWAGKCFWSPLKVDVLSQHGCSHWSADEDMVMSLRKVIRNWDARAEIDDLKAKLKAEKARSRARFRTIQSMKTRTKKRDSEGVT